MDITHYKSEKNVLFNCLCVCIEQWNGTVIRNKGISAAIQFQVH